MGTTARNREVGSSDVERWFLKPAAVPVVAGIALLGALLSPLGNGPSARLAAVLAFLGVIITYSANVIGVSVQRQAQRRLAEEHDQTEKRLDLEYRENSLRLELDAAMRAGQLINPSGADGLRSSGPAAIASGLLALTNLKQTELAVALLVDLWSNTIDEAGRHQENHNGQISSEIAILVINRALCSDSRNAQLVAAELLCRNAYKLTSTQSLHWPAAIDGHWRTDFSPKTKLLLVEALVNMTVCPDKPADEGALRSVAVRLFGISKHEEERVKACIGKLISAILPSLLGCGSKELVQGEVMVSIEELQHAADRCGDNPDGYLSRLSDQLATRLEDWAANACGLPTGPGCLATAAHGAQSAGTTE